MKKENSYTFKTMGEVLREAMVSLGKLVDLRQCPICGCESTKTEREENNNRCYNCNTKLNIRTEEDY